MTLDKKSLRKLKATMNYLKDNVHEDIRMLQVLTFLEVTLEEGVTMTDISKRLGTTQASTSRNVAVMSRKITPEGKIVGYNIIVAHQDIYERRRLALYLTDKGKHIAEESSNLMSST